MSLVGRVCLVMYLYAPLSNAYTWPNPRLDELDSQLHDRSGYNSRGLPLGMSPDCSAFVFGQQTGRTNAADWIRTVSMFLRVWYHRLSHVLKLGIS